MKPVLLIRLAKFKSIITTIKKPSYKKLSQLQKHDKKLGIFLITSILLIVADK